MKAEQFALQFKAEMEAQLKAYSSQKTAVGIAIKELNLSEEQNRGLGDAIRQVATDSYYTMLLALDGAASLNGNQQCYSVTDEQGSSIYSSGELEAAAWEAFYG